MIFVDLDEELLAIAGRTAVWSAEALHDRIATLGH